MKRSRSRTSFSNCSMKSQLLPLFRLMCIGLTVFSALLVCSWRDKVIELLARPIDTVHDSTATQDDQDVADPEKEQYAEALKSQGEGAPAGILLR